MPQSWSISEINTLKDLILNEKSLTEIYPVFPSRSQSSVRTKMKKLCDKDPSLPRSSTTRAPWTTEEDRLLKEKFS
jgi:hypothetical protein